MFYLTPSVQPPTCDLQRVVESAGGVVAKKRLALKTIEGLVDQQVSLHVNLIIHLSIYTKNKTTLVN